MNSFQVLLLGVIALLGIGLYGVLINRHLIKVVIALQILVKAALLAVIVAGRFTGRVSLAESMGLTIIVIDTIVAVLALALVVQIKQRANNLDSAELAQLKH